MKIGPTPSNVISLKTADLSRPGKTDATNSQNPSPASAPQQDKVALTSLSVQLSALESTVAAAPSMDIDKVHAIRQSISEGQFSVNSVTIADRLVSAVKEQLLGRGDR